ncbi:hypothetical protein AXK11_00450 [Cephaloticoccus primus]|uniref:HTH marR-type domain-containing protein n=1 Tax=Cephaloticoccus primus TaxID=1548207 RepID=A0A139ST30_9BACT|nr:hypothetical protein AXK11_00450 [Cephaloticoccus primus]
MNEVQVLNTLLRHGALSRAELARRVGLNRSSIGSVVGGLVEAGLLREREQRPEPEAVNEQVGRPGIAIEINPEGGAFIGVEIGIERLAVMVVDLAGEVIGRQAVAYDTANVAPQDTVRRIGGLVEEARARLAGVAPIRGLGAAIPALVDEAGTVVNGLVLGWRDVPLHRLLLEELGPAAADFPVAVENDANAFGVAALWRNPPLMEGTVAFFTMENGVGGAIFHNGELFRGSFGYAGEFGHLLLSEPAPITAQQKRRPAAHFENHVGKDAVLESYRTAGEGAAPRAGGPSGGLSALIAAHQAGEPAARQVVRRWGEKMAQGLTQVSAILNPHSIILGGAVAPLFGLAGEDVRAALHREFIDGFPMPEIQVSPLGEDGTPLGAALLMHRKFFSVDAQVLPKPSLS